MGLIREVTDDFRLWCGYLCFPASHICCRFIRHDVFTAILMSKRVAGVVCADISSAFSAPAFASPSAVSYLMICMPWGPIKLCFDVIFLQVTKFVWGKVSSQIATLKHQAEKIDTLMSRNITRYQSNRMRKYSQVPARHSQSWMYCQLLSMSSMEFIRISQPCRLMKVQIWR